MGKGKPKTRPVLTDLERAVWTLMCTDDYSVVSQDQSLT